MIINNFHQECVHKLRRQTAETSLLLPPGFDQDLLVLLEVNRQGSGHRLWKTMIKHMSAVSRQIPRRFHLRLHDVALVTTLPCLRSCLL